MIYFYYQIRDKEFKLDEIEHKALLEQMAKGKTMIILRGGNLMINMNHCSNWEIDKDSVIDDRKEKQAKENAKLAKLPTPSDEAKTQKYKKERSKFDEIRKKFNLI